MEHPITPPDELVQKLRKEAPWGIRDAGVTRELCLIAAAYRAGADQELEACAQWLVRNYNYPEAGNPLRAARRLKPPSLKEQALAALKRQEIRSIPSLVSANDCDTIRRALEALPND